MVIVVFMVIVKVVRPVPTLPVSVLVAASKVTVPQIAVTVASVVMVSTLAKVPSALVSFASALVMVWVGVFVPEPQVGVESFLELVVPRVLVRIDLVQVVAQLFAVADDGGSFGAPGKL